MKKIIYLVILNLIITYSSVLLGSTKKRSLSFRETQLYIKLKQLAKPKPFNNSYGYKNFKETTNLFFNEAIYEKLKGNVVNGYGYNQGLKIKKKEIFIVEIKSIVLDEYLGIKSYIKEKLEKYLKEKQYIIKENARYHLGIALVGRTYKDLVTPDGNQIEVYIKDTVTNRSCYYRYSQGSNRGFAKSVQLTLKYRVMGLLKKLWKY